MNNADILIAIVIAVIILASATAYKLGRWREQEAQVHATRRSLDVKLALKRNRYNR